MVKIKKLHMGAIDNIKSLKDNFVLHCIPDGMENKTHEHFVDFLKERRELMAKKIREYFKIL